MVQPPKPLERRRRTLRAMPHTHLLPQHTHRGRLLPDREHLLDCLPHEGIVAEVGVAKGDFSRKILDRASPKVLHLVDAWSVDRYRDNAQQVMDRFSTEIQSGQVVVHRGMSTDVLPEFSDSCLDWIYIDTNHSYQTTLAELQICDRLITKDGRIAGHDFCTGNIVKPVVYGVIQAVNEFCVQHEWQYEYVTLESNGHFSFCLVRL